MKKFLILMMSVFFVSGMFSICARADDEGTVDDGAAYGVFSGECGENLTWSFDYGTLTISGTGPMTDWTTKDAPWQEHYMDITRIVVEEGVTTIGDYAFLTVTMVEEISLPESLESIGDMAFFGCSLKLKRLTIPKSVKSIGEYAIGYYHPGDSSSYQKLSDLTVYYWAGSAGETYVSANALTGSLYGGYCGDGGWDVEELQENAWWTYDWESRTLTISGTGETKMTQEYDNGFWRNHGIDATSVYVEDGITDLGDYTLENLVNATSVRLPEGLKTLGYMALSKCGMAEITLPESLTDIGGYAFAYCKNLESIVIPSNVGVIGYFSFSDCSKLSSVTIPKSVERIEWRAFDDCPSLRSVTIPPEVTTIGEQAFGFHYDSGVNGDVLLSYFKIYGTRNTAAQFYAEEYGIPIEYIDSGYAYSFDRERGVLTISGNCEMYNLPDKDHKYMPWKSYADEIREIEIKDGITRIGRHMFNDLDALEKVTIASTVKMIDTYAFYGCDALTDVYLAEGVEIIGAGAFEECHALEQITLPESVTELWWGAFYNDEKLKDINLPSGLKVLEWEVFSGCTSMKEITIPKTLEEGYGPFTDSGLEKVFFENGMTVIPEQICYEAKQLKEIVIPESVTAIGDHAFYGCEGLEEIYLPESITKLGDSSLYGLTSLKELVLPPNLEEAGEYSCGGLTSLKEITVPESLEKISSSMFVACTSLERVVFPERLKWIDKKAFVNCESLKNIIIPKSVNYIGDYAFGYKQVWNQELQTTEITGSYDGLTIYGFDLSAAQAYAKDNGFSFVDLEQEGLYVPEYEVTVADEDCVYNGNAWEPEVAVTRKDGAGNVLTLAQGTDYTVSYSDNTSAGTAHVTITGLGLNYGQKTADFTIAPKAATPKVTLKTTSYVYDGKVKKPTVTVKIGTKTLAADTDYTVKYASGRKNPGKYKVTVALKGNYTGTASGEFTIKPKGTSLDKVTAASKGFTVKWKKQAAQTTGYQIQYATNSKFTSGKKTVTIKNNKTVSKKITGLKAKKKYYVRIRTYKTVSGTKYYSAWSKAKTVTTK